MLNNRQKNQRVIKPLICIFVFLLCSAFVCTSFAEEYESEYKEIFGGGSGFIYSDDMLFVDQYEMSTDLAKASVVLAKSTYSGDASTILPNFFWFITSHAS